MISGNDKTERSQFLHGERPMSLSPVNRCRPLFIFFLYMVTGIFCNHEANAADNLVTGQYTSSSGSEIVLHLTIQNPAPANLIVEQYFTPDNTIIDSSPRAIKVDNSQGTIKWLFKNIKNGNLSLSTHLGNPLHGDISAIVRYRSPQSGAFTELKIIP